MGKNVSQEKRRHSRSADRPVSFAGVLGRWNLSRESENTAGACGGGGPRHGGRSGWCIAPGTAVGQHGHAALWSAASHGLFHEGGNLGEFVGAAEPHEFCAGPEQREN